MLTCFSRLERSPCYVFFDIESSLCLYTIFKSSWRPHGCTSSLPITLLFRLLEGRKNRRRIHTSKLYVLPSNALARPLYGIPLRSHDLQCAQWGKDETMVVEHSPGIRCSSTTSSLMETLLGNLEYYHHVCCAIEHHFWMASANGEIACQPHRSHHTILWTESPSTKHVLIDRKNLGWVAHLYVKGSSKRRLCLLSTSSHGRSMARKKAMNTSFLFDTYLLSKLELLSRCRL